MDNVVTFTLEPSINSEEFDIQYPSDSENDLDMATQDTAIDLVVDSDITGIHVVSALSDYEVNYLTDFSFTTTIYRVAPTLLSEMDGLALSSFDSEKMFDVDYTIQV